MTYKEANCTIDSISWFYGGESITKEDMIECREMCHQALEKQIPQKPTWNDNVPHSRCPVCDSIVAAFIDSPKPNYCYWCGQKLDWGVQIDRERD